jgi:hypothetical protein
MQSHDIRLVRSVSHLLIQVLNEVRIFPQLQFLPELEKVLCNCVGFGPSHDLFRPDHPTDASCRA